MLTEHDRKIRDYMLRKHSGRCAYSPARLCDGLCNNCPFDVERDEFRRYSPYGSLHPNLPDYEELILARQERDDL